MIQKFKDEKGKDRIFMSENRKIAIPGSSYYISNNDGRGIEIGADALIKYFEYLIDNRLKIE